MYLSFFLVGGVCFFFLSRRCGRVRKKHHCEADEDSTRQRLQRGVSAGSIRLLNGYVNVSTVMPFAYSYGFPLPVNNTNRGPENSL